MLGVHIGFPLLDVLESSVVGRGGAGEWPYVAAAGSDW